MMEEKIIMKRPPKSPGLAGVLAFFFPGVGALYNGQVGRFFVHLQGRQFFALPGIAFGQQFAQSLRGACEAQSNDHDECKVA